MTTTVSQIIGIMARIAPPELAASWDNSGLQVGRPDWPVQKIMVSLDPGREAITSAAEASADMLICHHPLIFRPLKRIDLSTPVGEVVGIAVRNRIAVYAAHTSFDSAHNGLNDGLALKIGLRDLSVLEPAKTEVPRDEKERTGLGRVGTLEETMRLDALCRHLKETLGLDRVRMTGRPESQVRRVALCSGSGGSLIERFFSSDAEVYITGDVNYHDALEVRSRGRAVIDIGHFGSEHIMVEQMAARLGKMLQERHPGIQVMMCGEEQNPFITI